MGFEPMHRSFADSPLTSWAPRPNLYSIPLGMFSEILYGAGRSESINGDRTAHENKNRSTEFILASGRFTEFCN